ncbi:conserved hypothetical protein [metagenome]|uniref:Uncharacterized protein n=1 Tax=metagenome TaxID=256318 RepID=A0A2P2BZ98_9ZZZZ
MTENDPTPEPELTPAQEDAVRRRLAAVRHTDPIPAEVSARLDRVLAGLADERLPAPLGDPADELSARRRRRRVTQLLVAAVAVVAVGFGFGQLGGRLGSGDDSGDASSAGAESADRDGVQPQDSSGGGDEPTDGAGTLSRLAIVSRDRLEKDALSSRSEAYSFDAATRKACLEPGPDELSVAVVYQGKLATLVYRQPANDLQKVDLYRCDPPDFVRSVQIPAP